MAANFDPRLFRHERENYGRVTYLGKTPLNVGHQTIYEGGELTRREYEKLRYRAAGWQSKSEYERAIHGNLKGSHEARAFRRFASMYADEHNVSEAKTRGPFSDFSQAFVKAYRNNFKDMSPDSPFAKFLVVVGVRDPMATYDVGETP